MELTGAIKATVLQWAMNEARKYGDYRCVDGLRNILKRLEGSDGLQHSSDGQAANDTAGQVEESDETRSSKVLGL